METPELIRLEKRLFDAHRLTTKLMAMRGADRDEAQRKNRFIAVLQELQNTIGVYLETTNDPPQ